MYELLNRTYLGKKLFFNFLGADFVAPKSGHRREKQPVLQLGKGHWNILRSYPVNCEIRENVFYFTSKALFVLEKIKF